MNENARRVGRRITSGWVRPLVALCAAVVCVTTATAQTTERHTFAGLNKNIPDGGTAGLSDTRQISSSIANLSAVRVKLNIAGQYNGDLYAYVRHVSSQATNFCVLLNRPGRVLGNNFGYSDKGFNVTLDSAAANDIHVYRNVTVPSGALTGTWQPDGRTADPFTVRDSSPRTTTLSSFAGSSATGEWTLYVADVDSGAAHMLVGWEIELVGPIAPAITWANPADILYGDPLTASQLNATAGGVAGTFSYTPAAGTILNAGPAQTLSVTFTPTDTASYSPAIRTVQINVQKAPLTVTAAPASRAYGDANPAFTGTMTGVRNADVLTPSYTCTATPQSPAGTYSIVAGVAGPRLSNYTVTLNNALLTINKATLNVTANSASRTYGDANPVFTGTITGVKNSETITATYTCAATPASNVGTYGIVANAAGATIGNYTVVANNGTLTVGKAGLTITANNASRTYGDANPVFTGTITGVKNSETITATYTCAAIPASNVGTYDIVPNAAGATIGNYTVVANNGTLTVGKAGLTITANNASRTYGDANPVFTGTITGVKNSETITATYTCAATPASNVGTYDIVPNALGATIGNYTVVANNGTLTVGKAGLTITANNASRAYGDANPVFTGTITGVKNSETITATYTCAATPDSNVGTYDIVPNAAGATIGNYTVVANNGTLTVGKTGLTITANSATRSYGTPNPAFTGTIVGIKNGEAISAAYSSPAVLTSSAGTYDINPSPVGSTLGNYNVTVNKGILTIGKAGSALTVTAAPNPVLPGDPLVITATLAPVAPAVGTLSGSVLFRVDGNAAGAPVAIVAGSASLSISTLSLGNHSIRAEYSGDGNFETVTNSMSGVVLVNTQPVASTDTLYRNPTNGTKVDISTLLANDYDLDEDNITFVGVASSSANGASIVAQGGWLYYQPPAGFTSADSFTYTIRDGRGSPVTGTVNVLIRVDNSPAVNLVIVDLGNGSYRLHFNAIPNRACIIEYSPSMEPAVWNTLTTGTTDSSGVFEYVDTPGGASRFYRSVFP